MDSSSPLVLKCQALALYSDNRSAIELVKSMPFHNRTEHIAIHYHCICEVYNDGTITLEHHGTDDVPADVFNKRLIRLKLTKFPGGAFHFRVLRLLFYHPPRLTAHVVELGR